MPDRNEIRKLIQEEISFLLFSDRYVFQKHLQLLDGVNVQVAKGTGSKIGTETTQKLGFFGQTPVDKPETVSDPSISSVSDGGNTTTNATINSNFSALDSAVGAIIDRLQELGLMK